MVQTCGRFRCHVRFRGMECRAQVKMTILYADVGNFFLTSWLSRLQIADEQLSARCARLTEL